VSTNAFHRLHQQERPFILPNAWDYASAAALADAGFSAVGTTSLGVAAAAGLPDATGATRAETIALARGLTRLPIPITVDIEAGFGGDPADVADLAADLAAAGVAGINIEDGRPATTLADPDELAEVIAAIKARAPELFVNARIDTYWLGLGHDTTLDRAERYRKAGADGIFVPGVRDSGEIRRIVTEIPLPLNLLFLPDGPTVADLSALGVRRISTGSLLFRAALAATVSTALAVRDATALPIGIPPYDDVQALVTPK